MAKIFYENFSKQKYREEQNRKYKIVKNNIITLINETWNIVLKYFNEDCTKNDLKLFFSKFEQIELIQYKTKFDKKFSDMLSENIRAFNEVLPIIKDSYRNFLIEDKIPELVSLIRLLKNNSENYLENFTQWLTELYNFKSYSECNDEENELILDIMPFFRDILNNIFYKNKEIIEQNLFESYDYNDEDYLKLKLILEKIFVIKEINIKKITFKILQKKIQKISKELYDRNEKIFSDLKSVQWSLNIEDYDLVRSYVDILSSIESIKKLNEEGSDVRKVIVDYNRCFNDFFKQEIQDLVEKAYLKRIYINANKFHTKQEFTDLEETDFFKKWHELVDLIDIKNKRKDFENYEDLKKYYLKNIENKQNHFTWINNVNDYSTEVKNNTNNLLDKKTDEEEIWEKKSIKIRKFFWEVDVIWKRISNKINFLKLHLKAWDYNQVDLKEAPLEWNLESFTTFIDLWTKEKQSQYSGYINWKLEKTDLDKDFFKPKFIYYNKNFILTSSSVLINALIEHELSHVDYTDFSDNCFLIQQVPSIFSSLWEEIFELLEWQNKRKIFFDIKNNIEKFFNNWNEDLYVWNKLMAKSSNKHYLVENSYVQLGYKNVSIDESMRGMSKLEQMVDKIRAFWLASNFPSYAEKEVLVDTDVEEIFIKEILPHFNELISIKDPNEDRIKLKNEILIPIFTKLYAKDLLIKLKKENISENVSWDIWKILKNHE